MNIKRLALFVLIILLGYCALDFTSADILVREIILNTGLGQGFLYRPLPEWVGPAVDWAYAMAQEADPIEQSKLDSRILLLHHAPWKETMAILDAGTGLIVIDTWASPVSAKKASAIIRKIFNKPVTYVINTHHHWDHTFGNQVFTGAEIIGHKHCAEDMKTSYKSADDRKHELDKALKGTDYQSIQSYIQEVQHSIRQNFVLTPPTKLVNEKEILILGNLKVILYHAPGLHTRSNLIIYIPEIGLLFTRREFQHDSLPVFEVGIELPALIKNLEEILASGKPIKYIIPGHGDPIANPDLKVPLAYLQALQKAVTTAKQARKTPAEAEHDPAFSAFPQITSNPGIHHSNISFIWKK